MIKKNNIIKPALLFTAFITICLYGIAQPFTNSWINYNQPYYKFKVAETSIYRISATTLINAGIPLSTINPKNLQLFARGVEIPIYIAGENDGVFNSNDFIEFYGQKNDGWFDQALYGSAAKHPDPYYSLFNDTIYYFLTWNNLTSNNRLILETDTNFSSYTPINYFVKENLEIYTSGQASVNPYYDGETQNIGGEALTMFGFSSTEGWFDDDFSLGQSKTKTISSKNAYNNGGNATLSAVVLGESNYANISTGDHHLRISLGSNTLDTIFEAYKKIDVQMNIPINDLGATNTSVTFASINDIASAADRQAIAYIKLKYPHTLDLEGISLMDKVFVNDNSLAPKSLFSFSNFNTTGNIIFYDLTNNKRIKVVASGTNYQCLIPNAGNQKECFIADESQVKNITSLTAINGTGFFVNYGANPVDTAYIIITHPTLMAGATSYANYRLNPAINIDPQNAVIYNIDNLYDQFAYGIKKHPLAIRNFIDYILNTWPTKPNYLFLLGKSIKSKDSRKNLTYFYNNFVPSYGNPASDNMITAGLDGTFFEPAIPTGRLAAKNNTEIDWYLNKVQQYESPNMSIGNNGETDWMKRILHFGGGENSSQQVFFKTILNNYKRTLEDTLFGGNVTSFFKNSTAPVQITISDSIKNLIGSGVALMTFLGHASATGGFDQNIDDPALWPDQQGKYPLLIGLACFAGDIHLGSANSTSEQNVILDNKGVIGFLSSVDLAITSYLNVYATELYNNFSYKSYGESLGRQIQNTIKNIESTTTGVEDHLNSTALNITFHGDPAIRLHTFDKPDYMLNDASVSYIPTIITSDIDSFNVQVIVANLGRAIDTTIILSLTRAYPDANYQDTTYIKLLPAPHYKDTVTFTLPVDIVRGLGLNTFTITIDAPPGFVDEISETNNTVIKTLNITSGNIIPIFPYNFAIMPNQGITLKASTANLFQPANNYIFQLDTTDYFNSPIMETTTVNQAGGVVSWTPNLLQNMPDSMVYFWRVGKDSVDATGYKWRNSSFQYISGKEGWQQDHFFQFENDNFELLKYDRNTWKFNFQNKVGTLKAITDGAIGSTTVNGSTNWSEGSIPSFYIDQSLIGGNGWLTNSSIHVAIIDSVSFNHWEPTQLDMGQANSPSVGIPNFFIFRNADTTQMNALASMLTDSVPNGDYIIMWTWYWNMFTAYAPLTPTLNTALTNLGAVNIPAIQDSLPFIFFTKKGNPLSTQEVIGTSVTQKGLLLSATIVGSANFANIYSPTFGPSTRWDSISWQVNPLEGYPTKDSTILNIYGVDTNGTETLIIPNIPTDSVDIRITNRINAVQYPYLRLNAHLMDDSLFTAPQLDRWQVTYDDIPEAALDPNINFSFQKDTVNEGELINCSIAVKNISLHNMDSLLVSFKVLNQYNNLITIPFSRQKPLLADSIIILSVQFSTLGMKGINSLLIDVNPNNDQLEKFHFNNIAEIPFYVIGDKINPLLDVTFDGIHILDGDIVSPETEIVMELTDENKFLALNDTSDFAVYLTYPNGMEKRIYFRSSSGQDIMTFIPASLPKNSAKIIYNANLTTDGGYKLRVQANDRSSNNSGNYDYIIGFEVINKSTITSIINYPNPFTTSTRFVFTLTGSKIPDIFKIQILTITGKVVREIDKEELGNIHIGKNISDFAWDGTDTYGDRLANGVYLYRVMTRIANDNIDLRATSMDWYFKKGYGKMYLFR